MTQPRIIVTGAAGFVGLHVLDLLDQRTPGADIIPISKDPHTASNGRQFEAIDLIDHQGMNDLIERVRPTHLIHLAGVPLVAQATIEPEMVWQVNVLATLRIARAILSCAPRCAVIFAGSAEVYGLQANRSVTNAITESTLLAPANEYAATKAAADLALGALASHGLKAIRFRPFNHTGPGQSEEFVIPAFAAQIARIEAGRQEPVIRVGNLEVERDFLDVRDVADAYVRAIDRSEQIAPGAVINLASGRPWRIKDVLTYLLSLSQAEIRVETDPARQRTNDSRNARASSATALDLLGWRPQRSLETTMLDVLNSWRQKVQS
jgi:GDP-4-dehydro-6-deoxy-D-mannose reductase